MAGLYRLQIELHTMKTPKTIFVSQTNGPRSGSVLLITLLVVSLLMLVVVAFSVYVRISLREAIHHQQGLQARAVARLSMNLALAELQDLAGPDQRVTARADMFSQSNAYQPGLQTNARNTAWTGVWDSSIYDETDPTNKVFLKWLVSSQNEEMLEEVSRIASPGEGRQVRVVGAGSVSPQNEVNVEVVTISNGDSYAWWIGDEGVKARLNLQDPYRDSGDATLRQLTAKGGQRHAVELVRASGDQRLGDDAFPFTEPTFQAYLAKVNSYPQISLIGAGSSVESRYLDVSQNRFHDISLHSAGVLANVKDGGLRSDLSLAFEMPYTDWIDSAYVGLHPHAEVPLYQPPGYPIGRVVAPLYRIDDFPFSVERGPVPNLDPPVPFTYSETAEAAHKTSLTRTSDPVLRGPSWDLLRNYYRLYKTDDPDLEVFGFSSDSNLDSSGRIYGRPPFPSLYGWGSSRRYGQDTTVWDYAELFGRIGTDYTRAVPIGRPLLPGLSPVVTRVQTAMSFATRRIGTVAGQNQFELDMYMDPVVTLWNPYNIPLKTGRNFGQPLVLSIKHLNFSVGVEANPPLGSRRTMRAPFGNPNNPNDRNMLLAFYAEDDSRYYPHGDELYQVELDLGSRVMEPGEIIVFSHPGPAKHYRRDEQADPNAGGALVAGPNTKLRLQPGVDNLPGNSGLVFTNVVTALGSNTDFPNGVLVHDTSLRFRLDPGHSLAQDLKYRVEALKQGDVEPFMASFQAGVAELGSDWSHVYRVQELQSGKQLTAFYDSYLKHANSRNPVNLVSVFNPRAQTFEQGTTFGLEASAFQPDADQDLVEDLWWGEGRNATSLQGLIDMSEDNGFWGPDNRTAGFSDWNTHVPMFEVPTQPMTSLGQFQHLQVNWMADEPAYSIGNSRFSPFVGFSKLSLQPMNDGPSNQIVGDRGTSDASRRPDRSDWTMTRADTSWLINDVLWDAFYFSGISSGFGNTAPIEHWVSHTAHGNPLPNAPYLYHSPLSESDGLACFDTSSGLPLAGADQMITGHLLVQGMFNINSTSLDAWRAILASTRKVAIPQLDGSWEETTGSAFSRLNKPSEGENISWTGFRALTDEEIDALAEGIVSEVRERGPFLSLSEFVNRRLAEEVDPSSIHPHMRAGALQAAIDTSGVNTLFSETLTDAGLSPNRMELNAWVRDRIDGESFVAEGVNGDLTQADILKAIGPLLSARSDTFVIRAYGEVGGSTSARAWCEAVVQRIPDYVQSDRKKFQAPAWAPHEIPVNTNTYDTMNPKRRFRIISFRWLNPEDV